MEFNIYGKVTFNVDFDIEANDDETAMNIAKEKILDYYHLDVVNAYHNSKKVKIDINTSEYEE
jgi:hypothetical protein